VVLGHLLWTHWNYLTFLQGFLSLFSC